jgi:predicted transport protein
LKPKPVAKERELQRLLEANLLQALGVHLLESEYSTTAGGRIDTLGIDLNGAPTIIEYKRNQNDNVINQALSYLKWMKHQKAEFFEMLVSRRLGEEDRNGLTLDWAHPRVICIAESFSKFDVDTVEIVPMRIELFTYRYYEGDIFALEQLNVSSAAQSSSPLSTREPRLVAVRSVEEAGETSGEGAALAAGSNDTRLLFGMLRDRILALGPEIVERPRRYYIAFRAGLNFAEIHLQRAQLKIYLRPIEYEDPKGKVTSVSEKANWTMNRVISVSPGDELDYVMELVGQSYRDVA